MALHAASALSGTNIWTQTGPKASDIQVYFSSDPDIAYARGGDSVWTTTDAGQNWTRVYDRNTSYYPFTVAPDDPLLFFVGAPGIGGLLRSIDGGANYTQYSFSNFYALAFGATASIAYGVNGSSPTIISRSTDKGVTWVARSSSGLPVASGTSNLVPVPYRLGVDRFNADLVYAGLRHPDYQGIYRSTDGGNTFSPAAGLLGINVNQIAPHPAIAGRAFVATSAGVFRSDDSGASWARVADPGGTGVATLDMQSVAIDSTNPATIYAGGTLHGEIFMSADGGDTWTRRDTGVLANRINSIAPRPGHPGEVLAGTSHTLYRSTDSGQNWNVSANGILASNLTSLNNGSRLRVGLEDGGLYESLDGSTWTPLNNAALRTRLGGSFQSIVEIEDGNRLMVMPATSAVLTSTTQGSSWQSVPTGYPTFMLYQFGGLISLGGGGPVHLAGTNSGIYKTLDDGATWFWASNGLPSTTIMAFAKNGNGSAIYAGTFNQGVYKSIDGGNNWAPFNTGLANLEIRKLAYDEDNDVLLVGTNNGLFVSSNGGTSYSQLSNPWPAAQMSVDGLVIENYAHGAIYVGFQKLVYRSVDGGQNWTELAPGNPYSDSFIRITSMVGDGPGVLYLANMAAGLKTFTLSPDIRVIGGSAPAGSYPIGTELPWQFAVTNSGPYAATFAAASWQVPTNVEVVDLATDRGHCSISPSRLLSCDFGVLQVNQLASVTAKLRGTAGGALNVQLDTSAAETDLDPSNNSITSNGTRFVEAVDLAATLTASTASTTSGQSFEYTLVVSNGGANTVTGATFETSFDPRDQYTLAEGSMAGCTGNVAGQLTCPLPSLAANATATWRWSVTPQWGGARAATAVVRVNEENSIDSNPANNSAIAGVDIIPVTDLSAAITRPAANVLQGSTFAYTATLTNNSVIDAAGVTATITLSDRVQFVSATGATCSATGVTVGCAVGALAAGASHEVVVNVRAVSPGAATTTVSVASLGPDPLVSNNSGSVATTVDPSVDLSVALSAPGSVTVGSAVVLTLTANNLSTADATGAHADLTLSTLLTYSGASGATCTVASGVVSCDLGTIAGGASKVVSITANAAAAGAANSSATVGGTAADPVTANNSATAAVTVAGPPPAPSSKGGGGGAFDYASLLLLGLFVRLEWARQRRLKEFRQESPACWRPRARRF